MPAMFGRRPFPRELSCSQTRIDGQTGQNEQSCYYASLGRVTTDKQPPLGVGHLTRAAQGPSRNSTFRSFRFLAVFCPPGHRICEPNFIDLGPAVSQF